MSVGDPYARQASMPSYVRAGAIGIASTRISNGHPSARGEPMTSFPCDFKILLGFVDVATNSQQNHVVLPEV